VTGGFHTADNIIKALLAGADITHLCSVLLKQGPEHIASLKQEILDWMEEHEYESVQQLKGSVSRSCAINPAALEHSNYLDVIKSYNA
jgi:dihydroorotate dehydrogenase (fumarate)